MRNNKLLLIIIIALFMVNSVMLLSSPQNEYAEMLDVEIASAYDIENGAGKDVEYEITRSSYVFEGGSKRTGESKRVGKIFTGEGRSTGAVRENRHSYTDKKNINGLERLYLIGEDYARYGISAMIDLIFKNPSVNDTAVVAVCEGKASYVLQHKEPGYPITADFIESQIRNLFGLNFFTNEYNARNLYARVDSEGRNLVLPYIEIKEEEIKVTGTALFKGRKMVHKLDISDSRIMNMLRPEKNKGILTIQKSSREYLDYSVEIKPKVQCFKNGNKYNFIIELNLKGDVISNTLFPDLQNNIFTQKEAENYMADDIKRNSEAFIKKMKNEIKVDCLELGRVAAAKYGRRTGTDWNAVVCDSDIKVNVKVKIDKVGRGNY